MLRAITILLLTIFSGVAYSEDLSKTKRQSIKGEVAEEIAQDIAKLSDLFLQLQSDYNKLTPEEQRYFQKKSMEMLMKVKKENPSLNIEFNKDPKRK